MFKCYYQSLYSCKTNPLDEQINEFVGTLDIPTLSQEERDILEQPITLKELEEALICVKWQGT